MLWRSREREREERRREKEEGLRCRKMPFKGARLIVRRLLRRPRGGGGIAGRVKNDPRTQAKDDDEDG
jgi:hypothetical protein